MSNVTYTAYLVNALGGIHGKGEGFQSEYLAHRWASSELPRIKRRVHFAESLGIRVLVLEKTKEAANV
jgi:hypothetical protein